MEKVKMKRYKIFFIFLFINIFSSFAQSFMKTESNIPKWLTDEGRLSVFPRDKFISAVASNKSVEIAKQNAVTEVARFIKLEVKSKSSAVQSMSGVNGKYFESKSLGLEADFFSEANLYGLEFSQPYFSEKENRYYVVAYIEKMNAWKLVESDLLRLSDLIFGFSKNADSADNDFSKTVFRVQAKNYEDEFIKAYYFGIAVNEIGARNFESTLKILSSLDSEINSLKSKNTVSVQTQNDINGFITQKISDILNKNGFSPIDEKLQNVKAKFKSIVTCNVNIKADGEIFSCIPGIKVEVFEIETGKIVYVFSTSGKRVGGKNPETTERVAIRELCKILENKFIR